MYRHRIVVHTTWYKDNYDHEQEPGIENILLTTKDESVYYGEDGYTLDSIFWYVCRAYSV